MDPFMCWITNYLLQYMLDFLFSHTQIQTIIHLLKEQFAKSILTTFFISLLYEKNERFFLEFQFLIIN